MASDYGFGFYDYSNGGPRPKFSYPGGTESLGRRPFPAAPDRPRPLFSAAAGGFKRNISMSGMDSIDAGYKYARMETFAPPGRIPLGSTPGPRSLFSPAAGGFERSMSMSGLDSVNAGYKYARMETREFFKGGMGEQEYDVFPAYRGPAVQGYGPFDPLGNRMSVEAYNAVPDAVKEILERVRESGSATSEQNTKLKFHLLQVMSRAQDPFRVVRLYKGYMSPVQLGRVVNEGMAKKLDYYWEHWKLPPPEFDSEDRILGGAVSRSNVGVDFNKLEVLRKRDDPRIVKDDPLSYK